MIKWDLKMYIYHYLIADAFLVCITLFSSTFIKNDFKKNILCLIWGKNQIKEKKMTIKNIFSYLIYHKNMKKIKIILKLIHYLMSM